MAAHGLWDIDTGASRNLCYTIVDNIGAARLLPQ